MRYRRLSVDVRYFAPSLSYVMYLGEKPDALISSSAAAVGLLFALAFLGDKVTFLFVCFFKMLGVWGGLGAKQNW